MTSPQPFIPDEQQDAPRPVGYIEHGWNKCKEQPMVPIGAIATTAALLGASASLRSGNRRQFQHFLRLRVAAQGVTVVAMVVGAFMLTEKAEDAAEKRARARTNLPPPDPAPVEENVEHMYPPRNKTKVSDFTRRLREAEDQQRTDDAINNARK
ncbi:Respiratory supercomplex factor 1, mitochondrial [Vanrija albida]|uniref:Respiratory supercomplex factor 1, mitochondrial n=1 Tax=Vanrija albida TaxID=181172 RepID=A0ABR3PSQ4_9TREE